MLVIGYVVEVIMVSKWLVVMLLRLMMVSKLLEDTLMRLMMVSKHPVWPILMPESDICDVIHPRMINITTSNVRSTP